MISPKNMPDLLKFMMWICISLTLLDGVLSIIGVSLGYQEGDQIMLFFAQFLGLIPTFIFYMCIIPLMIYMLYKLAITFEQISWVVLVIFSIRAAIVLYADMNWINTLIFA